MRRDLPCSLAGVLAETPVDWDTDRTLGPRGREDSWN
jgi:hypothetical protein